jgi:hypothetical protein
VSTLRLVIIALIAAISPATVFADCSDPFGTAGNQIYNTTHEVMQYCNGDDWVNTGAPSGGVQDGDKGSITVSGSGTIWTIDNTAVTNSMLAGSIALSKLATNGTPDGSKFLRDDGAWTAVSATAAGSGGTALGGDLAFNKTTAALTAAGLITGAGFAPSASTATGNRLSIGVGHSPLVLPHQPMLPTAGAVGGVE